MDSQNRLRGSTWQRYKLGQAQFTGWLKQTADKLADKLTAKDTSYDPTTSSPGTTAPHKAQKKPTKAGMEGDVVVHWRELEGLASRICDNIRPEDVPSAPINILRDVIELRKKSARFFSRASATTSGGTDDKDDKNATHQHIIRVLERVLAKFETLETKADGPAARTGETKGTQINLHDLNNMFEHLELQTSPDTAEEKEGSDVDIQPETAAPGRSSAKAKKGGKKKPQKGAKSRNETARHPARNNTELEDQSWVDALDFGLKRPDDEEFDYFMMVYCFFEDFNLIRSYICERWCDYYYDRSVSLNTLAIITNAAFELFQQMEHDLVFDMRRMGIKRRALGSYEFMMMAIFTDSGLEHIEYDAYDDLSDQEADDRIYKDEWNWLASPAFATVRNLLGHIPPGKTPMVRKNDRTLPKYGGTTAAELDKFKDAVINDLLFDVVCVKAHKVNRKVDAIMPAESELLLSFQDSLRHYDWSSAFIFSLQLYVDIRYILEDEVAHAFQQMQQTADLVDQTLARMLECPGDVGFENRRVLRQRRKEVERFMLNDVVLEDKLPRYTHAGLEENDVEPFYLLKHEPVWAGLLDLHAKIIMNEIGHEQVNRSLLPEAAAYLYTAARAAADRFLGQFDFPIWKDMEIFLASYSDDSTFKSGILNAGDDPVAVLRNLGAILPVSLTDSKIHHAIEGQTQEFKQAVRIRNLLSKRYTRDDRTGQFFMEYARDIIQERLDSLLDNVESDDISSVLQQLGNKMPRAQPHSQRPLLDGRHATCQQRLGSKEKARALRRKAVLAQLSHVQQIQILEDTINVQLNGLLSIDFMKMHQTCASMLTAVLKSLPDDVRCDMSLEASTKIDKIAQVPLLLGELLSGDPSSDEELLRKLVKIVELAVHAGFDSPDEHEKNGVLESMSYTY